MKRPRIAFLALFILLPVSLRAESFNPADAEPLLEDRALLVKLAEGTRQVRLQVKDAEGNWEVFSVAHLAGDEGFLKLRIPDDVALEDCRAEVNMSDPFPYSVYEQETNHEQLVSGGNRIGGPEVAFDAAGGGGEEDGDVPDEVQESDLWQWRGDTLYFFNQSRGLQVFDVSDPEVPVKQASLRMPAVGDQMYVLDDEHVLLLATYVNYSYYGWYEDILPVSSAQQTEAIVVKHSGEDLEVVTRVTIEGDFLESRMVGERLYVVTRLHQPREDEEGGVYWRQGLVVNSVDLSDPANPVKREPLELIDDNGWYWNAVVTASPDHLLVTTSTYDSERRLTYSTVHVIPIGRDLTTMEVAHRVDLKAHLPDKFKLRVKDDRLITVSQRNVWREELTTYVESFDLSGEKAQKLDELILAPQERLHATRFDGDRLYVVTFFVELRKDPLFVIDISNPDNLKSLGELEIPGWSTYLVPEGDRLLSVGLEEGRVAVSLFDVGNPEEPSLVKRVYPSEGRSWSEANWDEKAVGYLTEQDLLLLPVQTQVKTEDGYQYHMLMQLIDVTHDDLTVRGHIEHEVQGRRATALGDYVVSISGQELLAVDATDRDAPVVVSELPLAWQTDHVVEVGDYLWQIGGGQSWEDGVPSRVRVTSKSDPDTLLHSFDLEPGAIAGWVRDGERLYLGRYRQWNELTRVPAEEPKERPEGEEEPADGEVDWVERWVNHFAFATDILDLTDPMDPVLLGSTEHEVEGDYSGYGLNQVKGQLAGEHLIWYPQVETNSWGWYYPIDIAFDVVGGADFWWGGYGWQDKLAILSVDVSDPAAPALVSETLIDPKNTVEFGPVVPHGNNLLVSYKDAYWNDDSNYEVRHYEMHEISLDDPSKPHVSEAVRLPGLLQGVHTQLDGGVVLFTTAVKLQESEVDGEGREKVIYWYPTGDAIVQASVYDGAHAYLVSEVVVPNGHYQSTVVVGDRIYKPIIEEKKPGVGAWRWQVTEDGGELARDGFVELTAMPNAMTLHEGLLFADHQQSVTVVNGGESITSTLSGPVYTQRLRAIDVADNGEQAWLAVGAYGVETLDLGDLLSVTLPALRLAALAEGWHLLEKERINYVHAGGEDFVGPLGGTQSWAFRRLDNLQRYEDWARAHFNPTGDTPWTMTDPNGDDDGDGVSNVVEFVYGTAPQVRDSVKRPRIAIEANAEGRLTLATDADAMIGEKDVETIIEFSEDLEEWRRSSEAEAEATLENAPAGFFRYRLQVLTEPE